MWQGARTSTAATRCPRCFWPRTVAGWSGGLAAAVAMAAVQLSRMVGPADPTTSSAAVLIYVFAGAVAGWAIGVLREADRIRREAEEALAREQLVRARAEERAEMAAHLHDSVLQTLALIQRDSANESEVSVTRTPPGAGTPSLVVRTETTEGIGGAFGEQHAPDVRRCRGYPPRPHRFGHRGRCRRAQPSTESLVQAAREAIVNAAKHSGADRVAVYAEALPERVTVFVRDRGRGFDFESVSIDRRGIRESIIKRLERSGGRASVASKIGEGTEVELVIERMTVRVFIVDDHDLFRSGVRAGLGDTVDIVGEASEVGAAVEMINERVPDVVLLDVHMPAGGGKAVIEGVREQNPAVEFLGFVGIRCSGRRRGHRACRGARLRDQDNLGGRPQGGDRQSGRRPRGVLAAIGRVRAQRFLVDTGRPKSIRNWIS